MIGKYKSFIMILLIFGAFFLGTKYTSYEDRIPPANRNVKSRHEKTKVVMPVEKILETEVSETDMLGTTNGLPGGYYADIARVKEKYGIIDEAEELFQKAIAQEADKNSKARYSIMLCRVYLRKKDTEKAEEISRQAIGSLKNKNDKERLQFAVASLFAQYGINEKAVNILKSISQSPSNEAGKMKALQQIDRILGKTPSSEKASLVINSLLDKLKKDPEDVKSLISLATVYGSKRMYKDAFNVYLKLVNAENNQFKKSSYNLFAAQNAFKFNDYLSAEKYALIALSLSQDGEFNLQCHSLLGKVYTQTRCFDKAESTYKLIIEKTKDKNLVDRGNRELLFIYQMTNRLSVAAQKYEDILKKDENDKNALKQLVQIWWTYGKRANKAKPYAEKLSKAYPDDQASAIALAEIYANLKEYNKSKMIYESLLTRFPKNKLHFGERLYFLACQINDSDNTEKYIKMMEDDAEKSPVRLSRVATLYLQNGNIDKGYSCFLKAIDSSSNQDEKDRIRFQAASILRNAKEFPKYQNILKNIIAESKNINSVKHAQVMLQAASSLKTVDHEKAD